MDVSVKGKSDVAVTLCVLKISWEKGSPDASLAVQIFVCPWNFPGNITGVGCHFLFQDQMVIVLLIF